MAGLAVILQPALLLRAGHGTAEPLALLAGVGGAVLTACAYVIIRKLREHADPLVVVFYFPFVALPASIPAMWHDALWPTGREWVFLALLGVCTQIGQVAVTRGLQLDNAGRSASYSFLQVPFAALWGALFFGERPSLTALAGATLILFGSIINTRSARVPVATAAPRG